MVVNLSDSTIAAGKRVLTFRKKFILGFDSRRWGTEYRVLINL